MSAFAAARKPLFRAIIAVVLAAISLALAFHNIDFDTVVAIMRHADPWWCAAAIGGMMVAHLCRAWRWQAMLRSLKPVGLFPAFSAVMIGYGLNQVVPRGGELVRPYILGRRESLAPSTLLATVVVERVIDVISLVFVLAIATTITSSTTAGSLSAFFSQGAVREHVPPDSLASVILRITIPAVTGTAAIAWLFLSHRGVHGLEWLARRAPTRYQNRLVGAVGHFRDGLRIVRSSGQVVFMTLATAGIWIGYGLATWFPLFALHLDSYGLTFGDAFMIMAIITVGRTIAPSPGAIGVYHYFCIQAMVILCAVAPNDAAAFATFSHGVQYIAMIVFGAALWLVEEVRET